MTTKEIAHRLVTLCREGKWELAQKELYAPDTVSVEPEDSPGFAKETRGMAAITEKGKQWMAMTEQIHSLEVSEPIVAEHSFACIMTIDSTLKGMGRMKMAELCVYDVKDGKVVREEFHH